MIVYFVTGTDLVRFKAEVHFDGMEVTRLHMKTMNLEKALQVCIFYGKICNVG